MNDLVPGFYEMDYEYSNIPASSTTGTEERVSELLWHNGNIFTTKNQPMNPSNNKTTGGEIDDQQQHLFMQEDEMASLLQFPLDGICSDLLYADPNPPPPTSAVTQSILAAEIRSPPPPVTTAPRLQNFALFSTGARVSRSEAAKVDSVASATAGGLASGTYDLTTTSSSPGGSRASLSSEAHQPPPPPPQKPAKDRKRKNGDEESQSEEIECEAKKPAGASTSTKRSHAAEVHNLSERRRRDKINEKMKALQDLVPKCNGSDKASMLEDTIQYVKTMQTQLQMMSMNMYPGPMVPYPPYMVPMPASFLTQQIHIASNETDRSVNLNQYQNQQRMPNLVDQNQLYQIQSQQRMVNPNQLYQNQLRNIVDPSQLLYQNQLRMPSLVDPNQLYQNQLQIPSLVDPNRLYQNQPLMQPNTFNPYQQFVGMQQPQNQSASQHGVNELSSRDRQATYPDDK